MTVRSRISATTVAVCAAVCFGAVGVCASVAASAAPAVSAVSALSAISAGSRPHATAPDESTAVVAVVGANNALFVSQDGAAFRSYGGRVVGTPAVLHQDSRELYVVRGTDYQLFVRTDTTGYTRFDPGLHCQSPPAVSGNDENASFDVACIGPDRHLWAVASTLPSKTTANPVAGTVTRLSQGDLNDDATPIRGGVGTVIDIQEFVVTGAVYPPNDDRPGGNTYMADPANPTVLEPLQVNCSGAPAEVPTAYHDLLVCHALTGSATHAYLFDYEKSTAQVTSINLGGATDGSPAVDDTKVGAQAAIVVIGTNGRPFTTLLQHTGAHGPFHELSIPCLSVSSPGATNR